MYDKFPYTLGGAGEMLATGDFRVPAYQGTFQRDGLIAVYPVALGGAKHQQLESLEEELSEAIEKLRQEYTNKAIAILPELKPRIRQ